MDWASILAGGGNGLGTRLAYWLVVGMDWEQG